MRPLPSRAFRPGAAAAVLGVLIAAPIMGGWAGTTARAAEPGAESAAAPVDAPVAEVTADERAAEDLTVPASAPGEEPVQEPAEPAGSTDPAEAVEPTEPSEPAESPEPAAVTEPAAAAGPAEHAEPEVNEPEVTGFEEPATASAVKTVAALAVVEPPAEEADEEAPAVPTFEGADGCTYSYIDEAGVAFITDIEGCDDPVLPHTLDGLPVGQVGTGTAMTDAARFRTITFPFTLQSVGPQAFQNATALTEVDLPDGVWIVAARAFENATALASIDLNEVRTVEGLAFSGAGQVTDLVLPASLTDVKDTAFGNMPNLRTVLVEGRASNLKKHTFFNTPALEKAVFHDPSATSFIVGNMFQASAVQEVFFHDGAMGLDCDATESVIGGATVTPRCLYAVDFDGAAPFFTVDLPHVEEGTVITEGPDVTPGFGEVHVGFDPSLPHTVTSDVTFQPVFEPAEPSQYLPSQDELVEEFQGGFQVPESVRAGEEITLVIDILEATPPPGDEEGPVPTVKALGEPSPSGTEEPSPGGTLDPTAPEEQPDINEILDVWMFSEPVELAITDFALDGIDLDSLTVQIPADVEPGEHQIAVFSVFGDLFGWQPLTVLPAAAPPAGDGGDDAPGDEGAGEEGAGDEGAGGAGDQGAGGDDATQTGATQTGATQTGVLDAGLAGELSETGPAHTALALGAAAALAAVGGLLVLARRFGA